MTDHLTRDEVREIVKEAVHETLVSLGVEANEPLEMQEDFAFVRRFRRNIEKAGSRVILTVVTMIVVAVSAAIGIKTMN